MAKKANLEPDGKEVGMETTAVVKKPVSNPSETKRTSETDKQSISLENEQNKTKPVNLDPKPIVELVNITKQFDDKVVLNNLNLKIYKGEFITLLGASGSGKTTALRIIGGFEWATRGEIRFSGRDVKDLPSYKRPTNTIFQDYALFPHLNVENNIKYGLKLVKVPKEEVSQEHLQKLEELKKVWQEKADAKRKELDIHQNEYKQLLEAKIPVKSKMFLMKIEKVNKALVKLENDFTNSKAGKADVNSNISEDAYKAKKEKFELEIQTLTEKNAAYLESVAEWTKTCEATFATKFGVATEKYKIKVGTINELISLHEPLVSGTTTLNTQELKQTKKTLETLKKDLIEEEKKYKEKTHNLQKKMKSDINKYTSRDYKKAQKWMDKSDYLYSYWDNYVSQNTYSFENRYLKRRLTQEEVEARVVRLVDMIGLQGSEKKQIDQLSGGMRQRVALARSIILEPEVLLLDEPLSALDLKVRQKMQRELKNIQRQLGMTFIFVTHDQEEAMTMSDKIAVMRNGVVDQFGTPQEVYDFPVNAWVAKFIGESNLFKGTVAKKDHVTFLGKEFTTDTYGIENCNVDIMLRPEDIEIVKEKGFFAGTVESVTYQGEMWEYDVKTKDYTFLVHSTKAFKLHEKVEVKWDAPDIHTMREDLRG